ncbi:MAG: hypothetical protein ACRDTC_09175 [Pseudonocardiaceae bacterium]
MSETHQFGDMAQKLARNPLGIIALFIVLVYGFASLLTAFGASFTPLERRLLIYFLVIFPVLVLGVFAWLVSRHSNKLFAPSDFRNEENYVRSLVATASLAIASVKSESPASEIDIQAVVASVQEATLTSTDPSRPSWRNHILWVDDRPHNNINERQAFEAMGLSFTLAHSTDEALKEVAGQSFVAIISDMSRREGPKEGYALLDSLRGQGNQTPFFIYAGSSSQEHKREVAEHGGQGCTDSPQELFRMVMRVVVSGASSPSRR